MTSTAAKKGFNPVATQVKHLTTSGFATRTVKGVGRDGLAVVDMKDVGEDGYGIVHVETALLMLSCAGIAHGLYMVEDMLRLDIQWNSVTSEELQSMEFELWKHVDSIRMNATRRSITG